MPGPCSATPAVLCSMRPPAPSMPESEQAVQQGLEQRMLVRTVLVDCPSPRHRAGSRPDAWLARAVARLRRAATTRLMARDGR